MQCARVDCPHEGRWYPILEFRAPPEYRNSVPAPAVMNLVVCDGHRKDSTVADLVGPEGWAQIVAGFDAMGKVRPDLARTGLRWAERSDPLVTRFLALLAREEN